MRSAGTRGCPRAPPAVRLVLHPAAGPHGAGLRPVGRITRIVADIKHRTLAAEPVPTALTCGALEENLGDKRAMADVLHAQGYRVGFVELPDVHNYVAWRDAFDPHLTGLLAEVWT